MPQIVEGALQKAGRLTPHDPAFFPLGSAPMSARLATRSDLSAPTPLS